MVDILDGGADPYTDPTYNYELGDVMYDPGMSDTGSGVGSSGPQYSNGPSITDGLTNAINAIVIAGANAAAGAVNPNGYSQTGLYPTAIAQRNAQQKQSVTTLLVIAAAVYFFFFRKKAA